MTCIINSAAGPGHEPAAGEQVQRLFAGAGTMARIVMVQDGTSLAAEADRAVARGDLIVVGGGDGSINTVASRLAGTDAVLGVLPMGTCNHFARDLGVPLDLESAVRTVLDGRVRVVDLGEVNGRVFLNNSSLGLYPQWVRGRQAEQRRGRRKWVARIISAASCLRHPVSLLIHLRVDGAAIAARRTPLLFVGNNQYLITGQEAGGRPQLDAGQLWMCMAHDKGYAGLLGVAFRALTGRLRPQDIDIYPATELRVRTARRRIRVALDGEVTTLHAPLLYRIRPASLRVLVPR